MAEIVCNGGDCRNDTVSLSTREYTILKEISAQLGKELIEIKYVVDEMENDNCRIEIHLR